MLSAPRTSQPAICDLTGSPRLACKLIAEVSVTASETVQAQVCALSVKYTL